MLDEQFHSGTDRLYSYAPGDLAELDGLGVGRVDALLPPRHVDPVQRVVAPQVRDAVGGEDRLVVSLRLRLPCKPGAQMVTKILQLK